MSNCWAETQSPFEAAAYCLETMANCMPLTKSVPYSSFHDKARVRTIDVLSESAIVNIPRHLRPHVAFLHNSITLYDPQNLRQQTPTRKFLEKTLVNRFRVQDIFSEVLIKRTPKLPVGLKAPESELCADILQWGLSLLSNLV